LKKEKNIFRNEIEKILDQSFFPVYDEKLDHQLRFVEQFSSLLEGLLKKDYSKRPRQESLKIFAEYKSTLEKLVEQHFKEKECTDFNQDFKEFEKSIINYILGLREELVIDQNPDRFNYLSTDGPSIKIGKFFKKTFRSIGGWPNALSNFFRKLSGKPHKERPNATHKVLLQNLVGFYYKERLTQHLALLIDDYYLEISKVAVLLWQIDDSLFNVIKNYTDNGGQVDVEENELRKIDEAKALLAGLKKKLKNSINSTLDELDKDYDQAFERVGTFELSNKKFQKSKRHKIHRRSNLIYRTIHQNWINTFVALSDDWEIDLELYGIIYTGLSHFHSNNEEIKKRLEVTISGKLNEIIVATELSKDKLQKVSGNDQKALKNELNEQVSAWKNHIEASLIPSLVEEILAQDLPSLINDIEVKLNSEVKAIKEKRSISKSIDYHTQIKTSALNYIYPAELINFESWPRFQKSLQSCKGQVTESINRLQQEIAQLSKIAIFNLSSAITLIDDEDKINKPLEVASEGLDRTIQKAEDLKRYFQSIEATVDQDLLASLKQLNISLHTFTDNENIFEIKLRIAKAKAIEKSKRLKKEWWSRIKNVIPSIWKTTVTAYNQIREKFNKVVNQYGLSKKQIEVTSEVADFLSETNKALERLPFVYQRLFKSTPLNDSNLFEGRMYEINALINAYNNFTRGRFASTIIIGEKGSGITTLLNFFEEELGSSYQSHRLDTEDILNDEKGLIDFFSEKFSEKFKTVEEITRFFLDGEKRVVIIENIQKQFLKKVQGFEALRQLSEIISLTSDKVFWINTCTVYAWNYLDKTIGLSEHYSYEIKLDSFDDKLMTQLILKRHQVSGYNLKFEPSPDHLNSKKFNKLSEEEKQLQLQKEYFDELNKIAKSNVSLALVFWQRSTCEVSDSTIFIASLKTMNFKFVESLAPNKTHALTYLLLHDGLRESEFAFCTNKNLSAARAILYPLYEDGILYKKADKFLINPLLYRHTVDLLKSKNVIH